MKVVALQAEEEVEEAPLAPAGTGLQTTRALRRHRTPQQDRRKRAPFQGRRSTRGSCKGPS